MTRILDRAGRIGRRMRERSAQDAPDQLKPPAVLSDAVGAGDYHSAGREFAEYLVRLGGLRPTDRVLDIGCGTGRIAVPLLEYLDGGSYEGFDVHEQAIAWCQANITSRNPAFRFTWVPVHSAWFNPWGEQAAEEFTFPYGDDEFDFAFGVSLFTHLLGPATERYLSELGRVLKPERKWLLTFFLVSDEGVPQPSPEWTGPPDWQNPLHFRLEMGSVRIIDPDHPDRAVAHNETWLRQEMERARLSLHEIHRGYWPGRHGLTYQDIVLGKSLPDGGG